MCGEDSREIAGLPIDLIAQVIDPPRCNAQRSTTSPMHRSRRRKRSRRRVRRRYALTASGRLASMQQRIEAMIAGVATVQPPLEKFYGLVNDEQKARLNAVAEDQESKPRRRGNRSLARACDMTEPSALKWPADEIEARLRPTDAQRGTLPRCRRQRQGRRHAECFVPGR